MKIVIVCAVICLSAVCLAQSEDKTKKDIEKGLRTLLQSSEVEINIQPEAAENTEVEKSGSVRDKRFFGGLRGLRGLGGLLSGLGGYGDGGYGGYAPGYYGYNPYPPPCWGYGCGYNYGW